MMKIKLTFLQPANDNWSVQRFNWFIFFNGISSLYCLPNCSVYTVMRVFYMSSAFAAQGTVTCTVTHHVTDTTSTCMFMSDRGAHLSVALASLHNCCQSQLCVPEWHNNSLIPLTWSAFLFSLTLLSGTCPAGIDPGPFLHSDTCLICSGASLTPEISDLILTFSPFDGWVTVPASDTGSLVM